MAQPTTAQLVTLLTAWRDGSMLADALVPATDALLASCRAPGARRACHTPAAPCQTVDTAELTEAQLRAEYKRTACRLDCAFFLAHASLTGPSLDALTALHAELRTRPSTTADRTRYVTLTQAYWTAQHDYSTHIPGLQARLTAEGYGRCQCADPIPSEPCEVRVSARICRLCGLLFTSAAAAAYSARIAAERDTADINTTATADVSEAA